MAVSEQDLRDLLVKSGPLTRREIGEALGAANEHFSPPLASLTRAGEVAEDRNSDPWRYALKPSR